MQNPNQLMAVVDDDDIFMIIARKMMGYCAPHWSLMEFANGEEILDYIQKNAQEPANLPDIMLLDINMPVMDGWMFLQEYHQIKETVSKPIRIYLASSSIDTKDTERAKENPNLVDYIIKPLTQEVIRKITSVA
jgi:two-component system, chemotaxis family, chemotaxis protein CheY